VKRATDARRLALDVLLRVERKRLPLGELLAAPAIEAMPARERDLLHELVLGTLRRRGAIDHALGPALAQPLDGLQPEPRAVLRLGAHQLLHLRVPARAAVHEAVALARERCPRASGLVNAVLRRLAREGPPRMPERGSDPLGWMTSEASLPSWLAKRWLAALGPERATARAAALLRTPDTVLRLNPRRPDTLRLAGEAGLELSPLGVPGAYRARGRTTDLARQGLLYVQELGSQLAARLALREGRLLDACAAPGGKSLLLADAAGPRATVFAAEASARRLASLASLAQRWGARNLRLLRADAARPPFAGAFQSVLLDAPCSGLGTLARHPDVRWRARAHEIEVHAARQREFLGALAPLVAPGGLLVYAVCSLEPEEGQALVEQFLARDARFEAAPLPEWCEPFRSGAWAGTLPERDGGDGFFVAPLARRR
jgi:16S rRNA (cytosine967-C5)-methyltransferase